MAVSALTATWKKYTLILTTRQAPHSANNSFVLTGYGVATSRAWRRHELADPNLTDAADVPQPAQRHPKFLRLPGGNYLEGNTVAERFDWKRTVGDISQRPGHPDPWGCRSDDGYGLPECLDWCEDLHMQTVLAVFAGYALGGGLVPAGPRLALYVTGKVYIKVVTSLAMPQTATFTLSGTKTVAPIGTAIALSSVSLGDTNTITDPNKVHPIQSKMTGTSKQFRHVFPPYSLTVSVCVIGFPSFRGLPAQPPSTQP